MDVSGANRRSMKRNGTRACPWRSWLPQWKTWAKSTLRVRTWRRDPWQLLWPEPEKCPYFFTT